MRGKFDEEMEVYSFVAQFDCRTGCCLVRMGFSGGELR